jgi:hypothetical protein
VVRSERSDCVVHKYVDLEPSLSARYRNFTGNLMHFMIMFVAVNLQVRGTSRTSILFSEFYML